MKKQRFLAIILTLVMIIGMLPATVVPTTVAAEEPEKLSITYSFTKTGRSDVTQSKDTLEILTRSGDPASWQTNTYTSVWNPEYKELPKAPANPGENWAYLGTNARFCGGRFGSVTTTNMVAAWLYCDIYILHTSPHTMGVEYVDGEEWIAFRVKAPATSTYTVKEMTGCTFANGSKQIDVYVFPYGETEKTVFSEGNTDTYGTQIVPFVDGSDRLYAERIGAKAFSKLGISSDYKVASANYYGKTTNTRGIAGLSGTSEFALEEDKEYVLLFNAKQTGVMHISNLTLDYVKPVETEKLNVTYSFTKTGRSDVTQSKDTLEILTRSGDPASWQTNTYTSVWNPEYKELPKAPANPGENWAYLGTNARFCGGRFGSVTTTNMVAAWLYCDIYILHTSPHTMGVEYVDGEEWIAFRVKAPATSTYTVKEMTGCAFANGSKQIDVYVLPYEEEEKAIFSEGNTDTYGTGIVPYALSGSLLYAERIGAKAFSGLGIASDYKVASANYYAKTTNTKASAPISGATEFELEEGKEYVILFNAKQTGVMHIANLTLEYDKPVEVVEMMDVTYSITKTGRPDVTQSKDTLEILTRSGDPASWQTNTYTSVWNPEYKELPKNPTDDGQNWAYLGTNARFCGGRFGSVTTTNMVAAWLYCDIYIMHTSPHTMGVEYVDGEEWIAFRIKAPATSKYTVKEMTGCTFANGSKQIDVYVFPYGESEKTIFSEGNTDTYGTGIVPYALSGSLLYAERIGGKPFSSLGISSDYKVASANYYAKTTNTKASAPISGATEFELEADKEYVVLFNAKQTGVMHIANLTLEYVKPTGVLTSIEAEMGDVTVGNKLSPRVTWYSDNRKINGDDGIITMEVIEDDGNVLLSTEDGRIFAIGEGTATVKVTGTLNGNSKSADVIVTVGAQESGNGIKDVAITLSDVVIGTDEYSSIHSISAKDMQGNVADLSDAYIKYSVADAYKNIVEVTTDGSFKGLSEGVAEIKAYIIANNGVAESSAMLTVDNTQKIKNAYLYTGTELRAGEQLVLTVRLELENRKLIAGGKIVGFEIVSESENGVMTLTDNELSAIAKKEGSADVRAKVLVRGNEYYTDTVKITVKGSMPEYPSSFRIDFRQGMTEGDTFEYINDIVSYSPSRNWVFHEFSKPFSDKYERIWMPLKTGKYAQVLWEKPGTGYLAFKVKFSTPGTYKIDSVSSDNSRAATIGLYVFPVNKDNTANFEKLLDKSSGHYVNSVDYYYKDYSPLKNDVEHSFGKKYIPEAGEYYVVLKNELGKSNSLVSSYGDAIYPLYYTFVNENAMNRAELVPEDGMTTTIEINDTIKLAPKLFDSKENVITYTPESITSIAYSSDDANVASVANDGTVTAINEGTTNIRATIVRDGNTVNTSVEIAVTDSSGIDKEKGITVSASDSIYVYGSTKIELSAVMNSGKTLKIPSKYVTYQLSDGSENYVDVSEDGTVTGKDVGTVTITPVIDNEYLASKQGENLVVSPVTIAVTWDATVNPAIYTLEMRANAKKNINRYDWAKQQRKAAISKADKYVENAELLYSLIAPEGLPRYYHTSHVNDPLNIYCRYCGEYVGSYSWSVNAISNPWKVKCTKCKRLFPSNDFGSFYELGILEDKSWSYAESLMKHHKIFVCEDGENCTCSHPGGTPGSESWWNKRGSAEWYEFYGYGVVGGYLNNDYYPEIDEELGITGWGVDDGFGYLQPYVSDLNKVGYHTSYYEGANGNAWYKTSGLSGPVRHNYIAYYLHEALWYGVGETANSGAIRLGLDALREAFLYTGEAKYARAGAILLDRVADVYPDFDWYGWTDWRGNNYRGAIVDPVWSTTMSDSLTRAYDAFLPIYNDPYVINFLSSNGAIYESDEDGTLMRDESGNLIPVNLKNSPGALRKHIEDNILRQSFEFAKTGSIAGNIGTAQKSVMYAALALNRQPETGEMLDWIMKMGEMYNTGAMQEKPISGGAILSKLVDEVNRDGSGSENAAGYNNIWVAYFIDIADKLASYDGYEGVNLFENAKYRKMFLSQARLLLGGYYTAQIGDYGSVGSKGMALYKDESIIAFKHTNDRLLARALYFYNGNTAEGLLGSIFDDDPEKIERDIEKIVKEDGEFALGSDMMTGFGFAALRDGAKYNSASAQSADNTTRDFAIYFGSNNGHGHFDTLNLFMSAFGLNVAPDFGYPEFTGNDPNRVQWIHTTLSHNTVVVDEKEQTSTSNPGVPYHFDDSDRVKVMDVDASKVYKNCDEYRRTVIMVEAGDKVSYGVDFFHVLGGNDHLYSFHSQSDDITPISGLGNMTEQPTYEAENGDLIGTYAGPDVKYGPDPNLVNSEKYPKGYTWLKDVRTFGSIDKDFSVEYKVKDWRNVLPEKKDIRLRVTMLGEEAADEVSFATALPQFADSASNKDVSIDYMLVRRKGANLDSTFTTVFEPYEAGNKYIEKIEKVSMERGASEKPGMNDSFGAVKVTLTNGRVDYIIYSTNEKVNYVVDDKIKFVGFAGVLSFDDNGNIVYRYLNDGKVLGLVSDTETEESVAAYTGVVNSFTREFTSENYITFTPDEGQVVDTDDLAGRYVYIENDGVQNGAYKIESASENNGNIELCIGDVSLIRSYADPYNTDLGYVYNISENRKLRIPLTSVEDTAPVVEAVSDATVSAGSVIDISVSATSPVGKDVKFIGTSLPRGVLLDETTGAMSWKPSSSQVGENHFAVTVSDGTLETAIHFVVTVYGSTTGGTTTPTTPDEPVVPTVPSTPGTSASGGSGSGAGGSGGAAPSTPGAPTEPDNPVGEDVSVLPPAEEAERFVDLASHAWARDAINTLADKGIIKGTSENTFSPAANITRADFTILLVRAFKLESENTENFADVSDNDYFAKELAIARNTGIVNGIGDNKYAPKNTITRQDMMTIVYRAMQKLDVKLEAKDVEYADFTDVADYAKEAVSALITAGLVNGKSGKIAPTDYTTRAEVAVLIKRILDYTAK